MGSPSGSCFFFHFEKGSLVLLLIFDFFFFGLSRDFFWSLCLSMPRPTLEWSKILRDYVSPPQTPSTSLVSRNASKSPNPPHLLLPQKSCKSLSRILEQGERLDLMGPMPLVGYCYDPPLEADRLWLRPRYSFILLLRRPQILLSNKSERYSLQPQLRRHLSEERTIIPYSLSQFCRKTTPRPVKNEISRSHGPLMV